MFILNFTWYSQPAAAAAATTKTKQKKTTTNNNNHYHSNIHYNKNPLRDTVLDSQEQ